MIYKNIMTTIIMIVLEPEQDYLLCLRYADIN